MSEVRLSRNFNIGLLAALSGASAWGLPMLMQGLLPSFYQFPYPLSLYAYLLGEVLVFTLGALVAGLAFIQIVRKLTTSRTDLSDKPTIGSSSSIILIFGVGGVISALMGLGLPMARWTVNLMSFLDLQHISPEPFLSIGLILGPVVVAYLVSLLANFQEAHLSERRTLSQMRNKLLSAVLVSSIFGRIAALFLFQVLVLIRLDTFFSYILGFTFGGVILGLSSIRRLSKIWAA